MSLPEGRKPIGRDEMAALARRLADTAICENMPNYITQDQVVARLRAIVKTRGAQSRLAAEIGISRSYMSDVVKGTRPPTGKILDYLGLTSQTVYFMKGEKR